MTAATAAIPPPHHVAVPISDSILWLMLFWNALVCLQAHQVGPEALVVMRRGDDAAVPNCRQAPRTIASHGAVRLLKHALRAHP